MSSSGFAQVRESAYLAGMFYRLPGIAVPAAAAMILLTSAAVADDRRHAPDLPGVEEGYRIVDGKALALPPEPEPDALPNGPGTYRVGNWDVTISGFVSFEIGTGRVRDGR